MIPVSLVVPMYGSERFLESLFEALIRLDPRPAEVILLDDASPDASYRLAETFAASAPFEVTLVRNEANSGIAAAYNRLAALARHRWVHILDADDYPVENDYYARISPHLAGQASAVVTGLQSNSGALRIGNRLLGRLVPRHPASWWPLLGSFATRSGVIYRRDWLLANPFPDPAYPGSDIVHLLSLREKSRIAFERSAHIFYTVHANAASSQARDFGRYTSELRRFAPVTRAAHLADLAVRRLGQVLDRS